MNAPGAPSPDKASPASEAAARRRRNRIHKRLFDILERGSGSDWQSQAVDWALIVIILINVTAVILETVPSLHARYHRAFLWIEIVSVAIFTVEYLLRLWVADQNIAFRSRDGRPSRLRYVLSPGALIDLFAILPSYLSLIFPAADLRLLRLFRLLRFFKLAKYSPGLNSLAEAVRSERRALLASLVVMLSVMIAGASLIYLLEHRVQPDKFGSIPDSMWWAVATLTTVGYGDVVPVTPAGKVLGGILMMFGLAMFALPVGIIATAFAQEIHKRDFVVRWGMVSKVPLFAALPADEIADIMKLLEAQSYVAGQYVARKGEPADCMYFIASGAVELELEKGRLRMETGAFFGEIAVLKRAKRSASVIAAEPTRLLVLAADDLHMLMEKKPHLAREINRIAREKVGHENITPQGDIAAGELKSAEKVTGRRTARKPGAGKERA